MKVLVDEGGGTQKKANLQKSVFYVLYRKISEESDHVP